VGFEKGGIRAGGFQADPPEVGVQGFPGGQEALPARVVIGEGRDLFVEDLTRKGIDDEESGREGVFGHIQSDKALSWHGSPPTGEGDGAWGEEVRKDGGPPTPNLPVHRGSRAQATHRGWREAGAELLEGLFRPHRWRSSGLLPSGQSDPS